MTHYSQPITKFGRHSLWVSIPLLMAILFWASGCETQDTAKGSSTPTAQPVEPIAAAEPQAQLITRDTADQLMLSGQLAGDAERIYGLGFSSDGKTLAAGGNNGMVRLWDLESLETLDSIPLAGNWDVYFAPDDAHLATDLGFVCDIQTGERIFDMQGSKTRAAFSPDGRWMAATGFATPIQIWNTQNWEVESSLEGHSDRVFGMAFSSDNRLLVTSSGIGPTDISSYEVKVWDLSSGEEILNLTGHSGDIHAVAVSPDSSLIASASTDYTVKVWEVSSGELQHSFRHSDGLFSVRFSPDGALIASAGVDRAVKVWDVESGKLLISLPHADEVLTMAFSPDGRLLASGGYDGMIYLWGIPKGGE